LKQRSIPVLLCGMLAPRNLGRDHGQRFDTIYPEFAKAEGVLLHPFFLDGVATNAKLNMPDGLHPTAAGVVVIVAVSRRKWEELIARAKAQN
jgi:acyl-CoA thioesterase-1